MGTDYQEIMVLSLFRSVVRINGRYIIDDQACLLMILYIKTATGDDVTFNPSYSVPVNGIYSNKCNK